MVAAWPQTAVTMTARMGGVIAMVAMEVRSRLSSALMAAVFIMRIVLLPELQVQRPFVQVSRDMRDIWTATVMALDANDAEICIT